MYWGSLIKAFAGLFSIGAVLSAMAAPMENEVLARQSDTPKYVFAHFMVGIVQYYTVDDWIADMNLAKEIGIDAFALNCANIDSYTPTQLANAYEAASQADFKVFISFDFAYWNNGDTAQIAQYMQQYAGHPAAMQYDGGAVVSTFVGDSFDWGPVKANVSHPIFAIPNMQDPAEVTYEKTSFDGAFSWLAWPTDGGNSIIPGPMTTIWDDKFVTNLAAAGGKAYMAPNRWIELLAMKPQLIEIITWNDYGESHYIGPYSADHSDDGSSEWAKGFPHDAWRLIMKPYITAYKAGAAAPTAEADQLVYWYRPTPKGITCTNDTLPMPNGVSLLHDLIFVTTLLTEPATLTVTSGSNAPVSMSVDAGIWTHNFTMGVGTQEFAVTRNGQTIMGGQGGYTITDTCLTYNYNAYVGSFNATS